MQRISLHAAHDHIIGLTKFRTPIVAVEELLWNSLDADAENVNVSLTLNHIGGLTRLVIADDGHGLPLAKAEESFGSIGGSPKLKMNETPKGRRPHGKTGRGRLKAFGLGSTVRWESHFLENGKCQRFSITGHRSTIDSFEISDPVDVAEPRSGVTVEITGIDGLFSSLVNSEYAATELAQRLALYLNQYPGIEIIYDGVAVDATTGQSHTADYEVEVRVSPDETHKATLTVIEWDRTTNRALYLCDRDGFARDERPPGIQAPGWDFTAYFKSELVEKLDSEDALALDELHPTVKAIVDVSKDALRTHFRKRDSGRGADLVRQWKAERIYPYENAPADPVTTAEREVFDVCAVNVHQYLPSFENQDRANKLLTFRLIKQGIESNPTALQTILREVLALPAEKQDEFAKLLGKTKLSAIINAANIVVDRLDFLASLHELLFGEHHKTLNEPRQLHPILANELWLFGEQYQLGVDEQSLKNTLLTHIKLLGREEVVTDVASVKDLDGRDRYLDLLLYRQFPTMREGHFEHLVVELKRPSITLGKKEIGQIEEYAFAVNDDQRFDKEQTQWNFVLIGNDLDPFATQKCSSDDRAFGHIKTGQVNIYVRKWATVIADAKWRYEFFRKQLEYQATTDDARAYLKDRHSKYFPETDQPAGANGSAQTGGANGSAQPSPVSVHPKAATAGKPKGRTSKRAKPPLA
ncbi:MAG: ATP-binding protein [Pirellulales bacterium]